MTENCVAEVWFGPGTAGPIPQVSVGIPHFVNFPGTNGWMQIKGEISYGIFVDDAYKKSIKEKGNPTANMFCITVNI